MSQWTNPCLLKTACLWPCGCLVLPACVRSIREKLRKQGEIEDRLWRQRKSFSSQLYLSIIKAYYASMIYNVTSCCDNSKSPLGSSFPFKNSPRTKE